MKYIKRILFLLILLIISNKNVFAIDTKRLNWDKRTDIFYAKTNDSGYYHSDNLYLFEFDGNIAYCTEPGARILHFNYEYSSDVSNSKMSPDIAKKAKLIAYYGYDYDMLGENHHTLKYRLATQKLIWELVSGYKFDFYSEINSQGDYYDLYNEVNKINLMIANHNVKPSFFNTTTTGELGKTIELTDINQVLKYYEIYDSAGTDAYIDENTLYVTPNKLGKIELTLRKKQYTDKSVLFYFNDDSQSLMTTGKLDEIYASFYINAIGGDVTIEKKDSKTNTIKPSSPEAFLSGATYGIYDDKDNLLDTVITNDSGLATSKILGLGTYYVKEISAPVGYEIDNKKYYFEITEDDLHKHIEIKEDIIERNFEITKVLGTDKTSLLTPEVGAKFEIYNINNELVYSGTTDNDGKLYFTLPYGKYKLIQISSKLGYETLEPFEFEIRESGDTVYKTFYDKEIKARLKIIKVDEFGNKIPISNIKFKIKNKKTNEFVCQKVSYPENTTICEFETNNDGELITPYPLEMGDYLLYEVDQAINGYLWNDTPLEFTIDDNSYFINDESLGKILEVKFTNKSVYGEVVINKVGEQIVYENGFSYKEIKLDNVTYELYASSDIYTNNGILKYHAEDLIGTYKTKDGKITISNLYLGSYYIVETATLDGYVIDKQKYYFDLEYIDQYTPIVKKTFTLKNYLKKGSLEFKKTDLTTGDVISNVKIEIYTIDNKLIYSGITDKDGLIKIDNLPIGKYYIKETDTITGYVLNDELVYFEILENGDVVKANMTNKKITSNIIIKKVDEFNNPIPGVTFGLYDINNNLLNTYITNEDGIIDLVLEYGKYYIKELDTLDGYILNDEPIYFDVNKDNEVIEKTVTNIMEVVIPKTDSISFINYIYLLFSIVLEIYFIKYVKV